MQLRVFQPAGPCLMVSIKSNFLSSVFSTPIFPLSCDLTKCCFTVKVEQLFYTYIHPQGQLESLEVFSSGVAVNVSQKSSSLQTQRWASQQTHNSWMHVRSSLLCGAWLSSLPRNSSVQIESLSFVDTSLHFALAPAAILISYLIFHKSPSCRCMDESKGR